MTALLGWPQAVAAGWGLVAGACLTALWLDDVLGWIWRRLRGGRRPEPRHAATSPEPAPDPELDGWQLMTLSAFEQDQAALDQETRTCGLTLAALQRDGARSRVHNEDLARALLILVDYLDMPVPEREIIGSAVVTLAAGKLARPRRDLLPGVPGETGEPGQAGWRTAAR